MRCRVAYMQVVHIVLIMYTYMYYTCMWSVYACVQPYSPTA